MKHRPTVTLQVDIFPEDSFLIDEPLGTPYTAEQVAEEAWVHQIVRWVEEGYLPVLTVLMPDGSEHEVDLEAEMFARISGMRECTDRTGHLPGADHRWQECPTYHDKEE